MKIRVENFLRQLGLTEYEIPEPNRWLVTVPLNTNEVENFELDIYQTDGWISFTSVAMENLSGTNLVHYYELLFRLNSFLNGLKITVDLNGAYIALQTESDVTDFDLEHLRNIIQRFSIFYSEWFPRLIEIAQEYGLKFRKPSKKQSMVDKMLQKLIASELLSQINLSLPQETDSQTPTNTQRHKSA
jgi:hypothetical protein